MGTRSSSDLLDGDHQRTVTGCVLVSYKVTLHAVIADVVEVQHSCVLFDSDKGVPGRTLRR